VFFHYSFFDSHHYIIENKYKNKSMNISINIKSTFSDLFSILYIYIINNVYNMYNATCIIVT